LKEKYGASIDPESVVKEVKKEIKEEIRREEPRDITPQILDGLVQLAKVSEQNMQTLLQMQMEDRKKKYTSTVHRDSKGLISKVDTEEQ
jgi:dihydropteroate synthase